MDLSERSPKKAAKIVRENRCRASNCCRWLAGRTFYAVGGTWRALARLHMRAATVPDERHAQLCDSVARRSRIRQARRADRGRRADGDRGRLVRRGVRSSLMAPRYWRRSFGSPIRKRSSSRRSAFAKASCSRSFQGSQEEDPLIVSAREFNSLRSRAPEHGEELFEWTSRLFALDSHLEEDEEDRRLRHAACLLSDISWRSHPDYRGTQAYDLVANAAFIGVDHPSRAFLALAAAYRHISNEDFVSPQSRSLVSARQLDRARIIGAAMRVAYNISAAMPGVLPRASMICDKGRVVLTLPAELAPLSGERLQSRMRQFARLIGGDPEIRASL